MWHKAGDILYCKKAFTTFISYTDLYIRLGTMGEVQCTQYTANYDKECDTTTLCWRWLKGRNSTCHPSPSFFPSKCYTYYYDCALQGSWNELLFCMRECSTLKEARLRTIKMCVTYNVTSMGSGVHREESYCANTCTLPIRVILHSSFIQHGIQANPTRIWIVARTSVLALLCKIV